MNEFLKQACMVRPSPRQLRWFEMEMYAFIHFGVNTFTDREWGTGAEPESIFAPDKLDCDNWVEAIKAAGMKGMILTAKHHDGFCLWPSKYTEHSVKNSGYHGDVVKEAAEACRRGGIRFGFYLSPWDRNSKLYGTEEYNDYFCNQLTELLTEYGDIFCVWFDNACGEGENGKKQEYDFDRYISLIRSYQPDAVIFNDYGPDTRWCGNEAGKGRYAEWAVVPGELCFRAEVQTTVPGPFAGAGTLDYLYNTDEELGTLPNILYSKGLVFCPSEIDTSIRKGWFWHEQEDPRPLETLFRIYLESVGKNACLNLNVPPDRDGLIDKRDVKRLKEFGDLLKREFSEELDAEVTKLSGDSGADENLGADLNPHTQPRYSVRLRKPVRSLKYVILQEKIADGQRIESFSVYGVFYNSEKSPLYQGTTVGHKKICVLRDPFADQNPLTDTSGDLIEEIIVAVKAARGEAEIESIRVY